MKILYLCPDLGIPVLGRKGASVHVRELCGAFSRAGHQVVLAAPTLNKSPWEKPAETEVRLVQVRPTAATTGAAQAFKEFSHTLGLESSLPGELRRILYNSELEAELTRRFESDRPDFIYERASLYATAGVSLAKRFCVPLIVELNAPLAVEQAAYRATGLGELAAQAERWTLMHADAVVVVSSPLAKHVRALGVKARKIHVVPNGVNAKLFFPDRSADSSAASEPRLSRARAKAGRGTRGVGGVTLGFIGGLRPWHGVEVLPELLARLNKRHGGVRLVIAGDGQLRGELERGFRTRGLAKNVTFTGALAHEEMPEVIRQFDVALAPYPKHDHDFYFSPLKLYEYMACGVPVVASRIGQIAETVQHGMTGWLYPAGNMKALVAGCEQLLEDAPLRNRLGMAAAKTIHSRFTWDHNATRVANLAKTLKQ